MWQQLLWITGSSVTDFWESRKEEQKEGAQHPQFVNKLSGTQRQGQESSPLFSYHLKGTKRKMGPVGHNTPIAKLVLILLIIYIL